MNKDFLKFQFKSRKYLILFLFIVQVLTLVAAYTFNDINVSTASQLVIGFSFAIMMVATFALTPLFFNFVQNKKSVDTYFALPLSRKALLLNTFVFLFVILAGSWLLPTAFAAIILIVKVGVSSFNLIGTVYYILAGLMIIAGMIVFYASLYLLANNALDGIVMIGAYMLLPGVLAIAIMSFGNTFVAGYSPFNIELCGYLSMPFMACNIFFELFGFMVDGYPSTVFSKQYFDIVVFAIQAIVFAFILYHSLVKRKAERAEQNSDSIFAYPSLIYFYSFIVLFILTVNFSFAYHSQGIMMTLLSSSFIYLLVFVFFMVAHFIYRRKIYFNFKMVGFFVLTIVLTLGFSELAYATRGFGLAEAYSREHENVIYRVNSDLSVIEDEQLRQAIFMAFDEMQSYQDENYYKYSYSEYDYIPISLYVTLNEKDVKAHPEVIEILEQLRQVCIDEYYSGNEIGWNASNFWITEYKDAKFQSTKEHYSYRTSKLLSKEFVLTLLEYEGTELSLGGIRISNTSVIDYLKSL